MGGAKRTRGTVPLSESNKSQNSSAAINREEHAVIGKSEQRCEGGTREGFCFTSAAMVSPCAESNHTIHFASDPAGCLSSLSLLM